LTLSIAIDAMGGDRAPREVVRGAVEAARQHPDLLCLLVGQQGAVREELDAVSWKGSNIEIVPADHVIAMGDSPVEALRKKKGSSVEVATRLVKTGKAVAMVSAGNTGACVAAGTILLGLLPEVRRAGIAVTFHAGDRPVVVMDVGASVSSKPEHLIQYGIMATLYARAVLNVENPRVGLLNIGEEGQKGNPLSKATHSMFLKTQLNFHGNVEGAEIFHSVCDVVVCEGFVGNIVLKVSEGLAERMVVLLKQTLGESFGNGSSDERNLENVLSRLRERVDYSEFGGAPLLGVKGVMIIAHGRSEAKAIANAIGVAKRLAEKDVNKRITEEIRAVSDN